MRDSKLSSLQLLAQANDGRRQRGNDDYLANIPTPKPPGSLALEARYGLAGKIVEMIEPHSEADPAGLLVQLLVAVGNIVGRRAHFIVEADRHYLKLFTVLVGLSSKGRKGTAWGQIRRILQEVDSEWCSKCVVSGISSGEGITWAVRDPVTRMEKDERNNGAFNEVIVDPGIPDKRLLLFESEFASVLKSFEREGNKASAVIRDCWDSGNLRSLTKTEAARATGTHISLIGHITKQELLRYMSATEAANGFGNRILWVFVQRSKLLPCGGQLSEEDFPEIQKRLRSVVQFAKGVDRITMDSEATQHWCKLYELLADEKPGLLGAMTARAEPQILRLACLYAVLDESSLISLPHLLAAVAVWEYSEASCRFVFGEATGDKTADRILAELHARPEGLTLTQIQDEVFNRNASATKIHGALDQLARFKLAHGVRDDGNEGRPASRWRPGPEPMGDTSTNSTNSQSVIGGESSLNSLNSYFVQGGELPA